MSVLDPMKGLSAIARELSRYALRGQADPHLACIPVLVPSSMEGLVLSLDSDAVNDGRQFDPYVVVFHRESERSTLYVARSYFMSHLLWRELPEAKLAELRRLARVADPNVDVRFRISRPIRHGI